MHAYLYVCIHSQAKYRIHAYILVHIDLGSHGTIESSEWGCARKSLGTPYLVPLSISFYHQTRMLPKDC